MKIQKCLAALVLMVSAGCANAALITFEGIESSGGRTVYSTDQIVSDGTNNWLISIVSGQISFEDSAASGPFPKNGTDTMSVNGSINTVIVLSKVGGGLFSLTSLDLGAWNGSTTTINVSSAGLLASFNLTGSLMTFNFGSEWTGLSSVTFTNSGNTLPWTVDNINTSPSEVPAPATIGLMGFMLLALRRFRKS